MNRHLAHALGATALGALLLQPVTAMADPPAHARNENSAQYRGYVVQHLPPRHRVVHHHGHRYYYYGGAWYRPYGPRYVIVDPPVGPVYYVWNPRVRGYVVTDQPYRRW